MKSLMAQGAGRVALVLVPVCWAIAGPALAQTAGAALSPQDAREIIREGKIYLDGVVGEYNAGLRQVDVDDAHYRQAFDSLEQVRKTAMQLRIQGATDSGELDTLAAQEQSDTLMAKQNLAQLQADAEQATQIYARVTAFPLFDPYFQQGEFAASHLDLPRLAADLVQQKQVNPDLRFLSEKPGAGPDAAANLDDNAAVTVAAKIKPTLVWAVGTMVNGYNPLLKGAEDAQSAANKAKDEVKSDEAAGGRVTQFAQQNPAAVAYEEERQQIEAANKRVKARNRRPVPPEMLPSKVQGDLRRSRDVGAARKRANDAAKAAADNLDKARKLYRYISQFKLVLNENYKERKSRFENLPYLDARDAAPTVAVPAP